MARKDKQSGTSGQPALRVVGTPAEARAQAQQVKAQAVAQQAQASQVQQTGEGIFSDKRSGRDRREDSVQVPDPRRQNPERRRGKPQAAWWLERDYVESHHFVQKAARTLPHGDEPTVD
jgi:hypothetical protein